MYLRERENFAYACHGSVEAGEKMGENGQTRLRRAHLFEVFGRRRRVQCHAARRTLCFRGTISSARLIFGTQPRRIREGAKAALSGSMHSSSRVDPENDSASAQAESRKPSWLTVASRPGVAELADAADSKSAGDHSPCGFDSLLRDSHFLKSKN